MEIEINILEWLKAILDVLNHPLVIAIITFLITYFATQYANKKSNEKKSELIKKGLFEEIKSLDKILKAMREVYEAKMTNYDNLHYGTMFQEIPTPVYDNYYKDICLEFNENQRMAFKSIAASIKVMNQFHEKLLLNDCPNPPECGLKCFSRLKVNYRNLRKLHLRISIFLDNPDNPDYDVDDVKQRFVQLQNEINNFIQQ